MAAKVVVLGGGMVGGFMARALAADPGWQVTLCDRDPAALARAAARAPLATRQADLADPAAVRAAVDGADLAVGAVPGFMGFRTVQTVLEAGRPIVDISFFPEDPFDLDALARAHGLTCVVDCGVMPGLGGMLGAHLLRGLDRATSLSIMVGGLPAERRWPTEYKAPFSPIDVIEEYTRPARLRERGEIVVRPALSEPELVDMPGVCTLEAFNTDGLRTLLRTLDVPTMREKTLRYPGHIEKMRALRVLGFFSETPVEVRGAGGGVTHVRPLDITAKLLFAEWTLEPGMPELTVMRVEVEGEHRGRRILRRADLLDRTDPATGDASMSRTTGYPAVAAAGLWRDGLLRAPGVIAPETLAQGDAPVFPKLLERLEAFGIRPVFATS